TATWSPAVAHRICPSMPSASVIFWPKDDHASDPLLGMLPEASGRPLRLLPPSSEKPAPVPVHRRRVVCKKGRNRTDTGKRPRSRPVNRTPERVAPSRLAFYLRHLQPRAHPTYWQNRTD